MYTYGMYTYGMYTYGMYVYFRWIYKLFDEFFDKFFFQWIFRTYNISFIASFRIGVPLILFLLSFNSVLMNILIAN
jgi:flagellar biosynthesis protein FliR